MIKGGKSKTRFSGRKDTKTTLPGFAAQVNSHQYLLTLNLLFNRDEIPSCSECITKPRYFLACIYEWDMYFKQETIKDEN